MEIKKETENETVETKTYYYILPLVYKFPLKINGITINSGEGAIGIMLVYDNEEELFRHNQQIQEVIKLEVKT